ncbi:MAG: capsular polysaccharide biosynthesis protein [Pseudomonadota bacterium]
MPTSITRQDAWAHRLFSRLAVRLRFVPMWLQEMARAIAAGRRPRNAAMSLVLTRDPGVATLTGARPMFWSRLYNSTPEQVIGWGRKWSGRRAQAFADKTGIPLCLMEDGFLRSVGRKDRSVSYVMDDTGVHYDAHGLSRLEALIAQPLTTEGAARADSIAQQWRAMRLSKYNAQPEYAGPLERPFVLVVDQTPGDASISYGMADAVCFQQMLSAALAEYPGHEVILKMHPDAAASPNKGHFDLTALAKEPRVRVITEPVHPVRLLESAAAVYTVTSQLGFEALVWGKPVRCFGMPFYAGWGVTEDDLPPPTRRSKVTLSQIIHATLVAYPQYLDPVTGQKTTPEQAFAHIGLQRHLRHALPAHITAIGFSRWKRGFVKTFLQGSTVRFRSAAHPGDTAEGVLVWGSKQAPKTAKDTTILRAEDGFLRSSGLGADLVRPLSLVIDDLGIYYDATRPSRLERILQDSTLDAAAVQRAQDLRKKITALDLTKYNLGQESWTRPANRDGVLLVVGQVETDASIRYGSPDLQSNMALLARVRQENPGAYIVYKPHPDVLAGLRAKDREAERVAELADEILTAPVGLGQLLGQVDAVHTMTSLLGFEALMRGAKVICHGLPFYAGWGLTEDRLHYPRRTRKLSLDELTHGTLIAYPRYYDYDSDCFIQPEQAVQHLAQLAARGPASRSLPRKCLRAGILAWRKVAGVQS